VRKDEKTPALGVDCGREIKITSERRNSVLFEREIIVTGRESLRRREKKQPEFKTNRGWRGTLGGREVKDAGSEGEALSYH